MAYHVLSDVLESLKVGAESWLWSGEVYLHGLTLLS